MLAARVHVLDTDHDAGPCEDILVLAKTHSGPCEDIVVLAKLHSGSCKDIVVPAKTNSSASEDKVVHANDDDDDAGSVSSVSLPGSGGSSS